MVRVAWVIVVVLAVGLFIISIPLKYTNASYLVISFIFEFVYISTGIVIFWHKSDDRMALVTSFALITFGTTFQVSYFTAGSLPPMVYILSLWMAFLGNVCIGLFFFVFPTGQFIPRWTCWLVFCWIAYWGFNNLFLASFISGPGLNAVAFMSLLASVVPIQVYRYRRVSTPTQRQQTKWVIYGLSVAIVGFLISIMVIARFSHLFVGFLLYLFLLFIPLSLGVAVLRSRLWDIDIIINRTLVYGILTSSIIAMYVLIVVLLGSLFQTSGNLLISLLATGLVAVLFQPLRERFQRAVNRLLYGERDTPYKAISRLGQRLEAALAPEAVLPTIVETVAEALKLPYAAITLKQENEFVTAASYGASKGEFVSLPLNYQSELIGELVLAPRGPGDSFTTADRALLDDLARQAGMAAHAVRLTTDLQRLTSELQQSRTQLVTTREEERRRLRRDLHDGLGSVLASLNLRAGAIRTLLTRDPAAADTLVVEQQSTIRFAIADIRRLVYELRPPALDELGLAGAIRERTAHYGAAVRREGVNMQQEQSNELRIEIQAMDDLQALPAAIEVALYRITLEALANVVRHAHAQSCVICLEVKEGVVLLEITDDGVGLQEGYRTGVGLLSIRERAEELGGTSTISRAQGGGTRVQIQLPLLTNQQGRQKGANDATYSDC